MEGPLSIWRGISNDFFPLPFILPGWKYAACGNAVPPSYWRPSILGAGDRVNDCCAFFHTLKKGWT